MEFKNRKKQIKYKSRDLNKTDKMRIRRFCKHAQILKSFN